MKSCCLGNLGFGFEDRLERCFDSVGDESRRDEEVVIVGVAVPLREASRGRRAGYGTRTEEYDYSRKKAFTRGMGATVVLSLSR